ncbi:Uncharacterised protein [Prevotella intermedia]|nr:Uncharacterised protein [Prevotella intermedia]
MLYKTYCFAFQKRRFCTVKAAVLQRKTYTFATSNRNYHFSCELSLQNERDFSVFALCNKKRITLPPRCIYRTVTFLENYYLVG